MTVLISGFFLSRCFKHFRQLDDCQCSDVVSPVSCQFVDDPVRTLCSVLFCSVGRLGEVYRLRVSIFVVHRKLCTREVSVYKTSQHCTPVFRMHSFKDICIEYDALAVVLLLALDITHTEAYVRTSPAGIRIDPRLCRQCGRDGCSAAIRDVHHFPGCVLKGVRADALEVYTRIGVRAELFLRDVRHPLELSPGHLFPEAVYASQRLDVLLHHSVEPLPGYVHDDGVLHPLPEGGVHFALIVEHLVLRYLPRSHLFVRGAHPYAVRSLDAADGICAAWVSLRGFALHGDVLQHNVHRPAGPHLDLGYVPEVLLTELEPPGAAVQLPHCADAVRRDSGPGDLPYLSFP